jgi:hypothetical protein
MVVIVVLRGRCKCEAKSVVLLLLYYFGGLVDGIIVEEAKSGSLL